MQSTGTFTKIRGSEQFEEEKSLFTKKSQVIFVFFVSFIFLCRLIFDDLSLLFENQEVLEGKDQIRRLIAGERIPYDILRDEPEAPVPRNRWGFCFTRLILDGYICFLENDWKLLWTFPFSGCFRGKLCEIHIFFETRNPPQNQLLKTQQTRQIFSDFQSLGEISQNESVYQTGSIIKNWVPSDPKIGTGLMIDRKDWSSWDCYAMIFLFLTRHWHALGTFFFQDLLGRSVSNRWGEDRYLTKPPSWWCLRSVSSSLWLEQIYGCGAWSEC